ncbi:MAG: ubiquitin-activating E1 FCCH domain-containing protein [Brevundimonas sp.]|uniref:ubiquitin-activating E1 FCCH domain-containing protein n=1 Tax=Brevundimonas sp. TaxID=1871086 RepID=UPI002489AD5E|nr:ubiquitin-activating E1 FCCH domain-containing protein [Brevundimonas sp.]MDI1325920.1 ubiquitin-activating E1 FCCH domain-containing protein [Brevundimonas sp.]
MGLKTWMDGMARGLRAFTRRMADDARGNVAMLFGLSLPVLVLMTVGGVDIHRASTVRVNLQDALDAATLAAARSPYTANTDLQRVGLDSLRANLKAYPNITLREGDTSFVLNSEDVVVASSRVDVKTLVANIFLPPYGKFMDDYLPVGAHSEVDRSSRNIEVSLALDITGSMQGQKLLDLKAAAKELVDLVVQPVQTPYYSRIALVPWSMAVNPGTYLNAARGSVTGSTNITNATINLIGPQLSITGASKARPVVVTSNNHGFANGNVVWITGVSGMTQLNNKPYRVTNKTTNTFELYNMAGARVDGRNYGAFSGTNGRVQKCQDSDCSITVTSANHGLVNNDYVYITGVNGMTQINNQTFLVGNATTNTYTIDPTSSSLNAYTSGGQSWCAQNGCQYFTFEDGNGDLSTHSVSSCVTERLGAQRSTDAVPNASARVGRHYPSLNATPGANSTCLSSIIRPLSSDAAAIKTNIDNLSTNGVTAGQIGIAWGWYMVSPTFSTLWPSASAAPYDTSETLKAVIIMTDGEFNAPYCQGVIAAGYGANNAVSNGCSPDNGEPFAQSRDLCDAMKAQGVVVYTVGFQITVGAQADTLLRYCASTATGYFNASNGTALSEAFAAIGRDITQLRISR